MKYKEVIEGVQKLESDLRRLNGDGPLSPQVSVAIGGLHTCRDNLTWAEQQAEPAPTKAGRDAGAPSK
jgi:hypothetical protein